MDVKTNDVKMNDVNTNDVMMDEIGYEIPRRLDHLQERVSGVAIPYGAAIDFRFSKISFSTSQLQI